MQHKTPTQKLQLHRTGSFVLHCCCCCYCCFFFFSFFSCSSCTNDILVMFNIVNTTQESTEAPQKWQQQDKETYWQKIGANIDAKYVVQFLFFFYYAIRIISRAINTAEVKCAKAFDHTVVAAAGVTFMRNKFGERSFSANVYDGNPHFSFHRQATAIQTENAGRNIHISIYYVFFPFTKKSGNSF